MALRVVGAGCGRTGTNSLKIALERLLGEPCYHMREIFVHPEHIPDWHAAARGDMPDWERLFDGYAAGVDWPVGAFWPEIAARYPDSLILLSTRDADSWWESAHSTILPNVHGGMPPGGPPFAADWHAMVVDMMQSRFTLELDDAEASKAAFERHNARVLESAPRERLVVWEARDGWEPLCRALELPIPDEPFPKTNTKEEFQARLRAAQET